MLLLRARETVMAHFRPILHEHGVTEQQWRVLRALHDLGEMSATALGAECSILAPSMTRILRKLSEKRLVVTTRSTDDQRELKVRISPAGKRLVAEVGPLIEEQYALLRDQLRPDRLKALYRDLQHVIDLDAQECKGRKRRAAARR